ncbi:MAG: ABC transporter permease subunit [Chloroflexota bacterium]
MQKRSTPLLTGSFLFTLLPVTAFIIFAIWLMSRLLADGVYPLASVIGAVTLFFGMVFLRPRLQAFRWMSLGIALSILFTLYPIVYTFYIAFTNMGDGHFLTEQQAINRLEKVTYLPESGETFAYAAYQSADGDVALWLLPPSGAGFFATQDELITDVQPGVGRIGEADEDGFPVSIEGYTRMLPRDIVPNLAALAEIDFGEPPNTVRIHSLREAATLKPLYVYENGTIIDQETGQIYTPVNGTFTSPDGEKLTPGYITNIGWRNFARFLANEAIRGPLIRIVIWNFVFAFFSVFLSFALGLVVTLLFEDLPGRQLIRALLIIPYPIPALVSVLIWRSLLNPDVGLVSHAIAAVFGSAPAWFLDPTWAKIGILLVNLWLSYPYFYVISAGAIRAIPEEINSAAIVDGASAWQRFMRITMPLLLRILLPLLIASFSFNFNNFNLIYIFNYGDPPMVGTLIPVGHTDILISFVYKLAFVTSSTTDYGLAAAISIILFLIVGAITWIQARYTRAFQEM